MLVINAKNYLIVFLSCLMLIAPAVSQVAVDPYEDHRIESLQVVLLSPGPDAAQNNRLTDKIRKVLALYPGDLYQENRVLLSLASIGRMPGVAAVSHDVSFGLQGGVQLTVKVGLAQDKTSTTHGSAFPLLYDQEGQILRAKVELLGMYYGNKDAWFGREDVMLDGNPFAIGQSAGQGYSDWLEGFVHGGLYGVTPLAAEISLYGGVSAIASGSSGQELFTDETRTHVATEDAFVGVVGGSVSEAGDRLVYNLSAGRQRFSLGEGFLLVNTSQNGLDRAALQSNPRWAGDNLVLAQFAYNNIKADIFEVDPDELTQIDSNTRIRGANLQANLADYQLGYAYLYVPESSTGYYTTSAQFSRDGLRVQNIRFRWQPLVKQPDAAAMPFFSAEIAKQTNRYFDMAALAYFFESGYSFPSAKWGPTLSYRYARFSGDKANTSTFERWDPLLTGGNGESWVQGINHFKLFQNSNLISHRVQLRLRPQPQIELVPQLWLFKADSLTNLGGNPALSFLTDDDLGKELNITAKYFYSRNIMLQGHVAATFAGKAIKQGLDTHHSPWISTMLFLRVGF
jgi:hypothetical protein